MASPTRVSERVRKAKRTASGQGRKREIAKQQRINAEAKLAEALGERIELPTIR